MKINITLNFLYFFRKAIARAFIDRFESGRLIGEREILTHKKTAPTISSTVVKKVFEAVYLSRLRMVFIPFSYQRNQTLFAVALNFANSSFHVFLVPPWPPQQINRRLLFV